MKKKVTFWKRIKLIINAAMEYKIGTYTVCQFCDSPSVSFEVIKDEGRFYAAKYTCHYCGAVGYVAERWIMKEEKMKEVE